MLSSITIAKPAATPEMNLKVFLNPKLVPKVMERMLFGPGVKVLTKA